MIPSFAAAVNTYDAAAMPQRLAATRLTLEAWRGIALVSSPGEGVSPACVIDLGCGTGLASRAWLDQLRAIAQPPPRQLVLVDQAPAMVKRAMALLSSRHGNVQGLALDAFQEQAMGALATQLPPDGSRLLLSSYALQWSPAPLEVLQRVWALFARSGDWLALAVPDASSFALLRAALAAANLPSHLLPLPEHQALIGPRAQRALAPWWRWVAGGVFVNAVPVGSAVEYLRHFTLIGARPERSRYAPRDVVRLRRCLEGEMRRSSAQLDYHSTWMLLQRI